MPDINERKLVEQAQNEPQAFAVLYDRYVARIFKYVYRQVQDEMVAQDVTAVTFEKALRHIRRYELQDSSFGAWLYRIARNELMSHYRRQKFLSPLKWFGQTEERGTETAVAQRDEHSQLHYALTQLSAKDRDIINLRYFEELSSGEVAKVLGCSPQNVYLRLHRALKQLQQQLEKIEYQGDWRLESNLPNSR
jgi:RNA polymerase sigma-70 factor (ECF subfamily)